MKRFASLLLVVLAMCLSYSRIASAQVDNFTITDYRIHYYLSRDDEQRSTLETTETITADFQVPNQNRGIERAIPKDYDGHPTSLHIKHVQDETGQDRQYTTYESSGNMVVRIGDADRYVTGKQTYVIKYTQRDITRFFSDTNRDEFYWDTNGTDWRVPIDRLEVALTIDEALSGSLSDNTACYQGAHGSGLMCDLARFGNEYIATATGLNRNENLTLAVGFQPNTFAAYQKSLTEKIMHGWFVLQILLTGVGLGILFWLVARYDRWSNRKKELSTIVPEYLPPKDISVTTSAKILGSHKELAAQIIDLAVRHYLRIYQTREKSTFKPAEYKIEVIKDVSTLLAEEQEILKDMFGHLPKLGDSLELKTLQQSTSYQSRITDNPKKLRELVRGAYGLRHKVPEKSSWFNRRGHALLILSILLLSPMLLLVAILAYVLGHMLWPLTDRGLGLVRYLKGLKIYISVAEEERLQQLQSPDGAAKVGTIDQPGSPQLIKLYERVLPYAILFGQENQWNDRLAAMYQQNNASPDWLVGSHGSVLSAAAFSGAVSNLTSQYSSATYSSSGGSGGGGSSGGGGGGGGGGGW